jgi:hypothetical protein
MVSVKNQLTEAWDEVSQRLFKMIQIKPKSVCTVTNKKELELHEFTCWFSLARLGVGYSS